MALANPAKFTLVVLVAFACGMASPVIAREVVAFARNANRVDGLHAVRSTSPKVSERLVATDSQGKLPRRILPTVRNADRVDGLDSTEFIRRCARGSVRAWAQVVGNVSPDSGFVRADLQGGDSFNCADDRSTVYYRHVGPGEYELRFPGFDRETDDAISGYPFLALITIGGGEGPFEEDGGLMSEYRTLSDDDRVLMRVRITNRSGDPEDADFTVALLHAAL